MIQKMTITKFMTQWNNRNFTIAIKIKDLGKESILLRHLDPFGIISF